MPLDRADHDGLIPKPFDACSSHAGVTENSESRPVYPVDPEGVYAGERWLQAVGFPGYEVSDFGRVRRTGRRILRSFPFNRKTRGDRNYLGVCLSVEGKVTKIAVHSLVARAFLGPQDPSMEVDHIDGDRTNARLTNLEYVTPSENSQRSWVRRRAKIHENSKRLGLLVAAEQITAEAADAAARLFVEGLR